MYIEFALDKDQAASNLLLIRYHLVKWANQNDQIKYTEKTIKLKHRVTFDDEKLYTYFAMTWNAGQHNWLKYRLIEPMKTRQP
jgi:hypothetical protein